MGSLGGGSSQPSGTVVQKTDTSPWEPQQDYLKTGFSEAQKLYDSQTPEYYAGNTVNPLADQTQTALDLQQARACARLVKTTAEFDAQVEVRAGDHVCDGKSIMGLMMLAATQGTHICVTADGDDAQTAINQIRALFANRFGEDE